MTLLINTNSKQIALADQTDRVDWVSVDPAASLTSEIAEVMDRNNLDLTDIELIAVVQGDGSFSHTREGIVFANVMSFARNIPVISISREELSDLRLETEFRGETRFQAAQYNAEPNIS